MLHRLADSAQKSASDQQAWQRFQQCINATVEHMVQLAIRCYKSSETVTAVGRIDPQQQQDMLRMCCDWVTRVISLPEPTCRHYQGADMITDVSRKAQESLQAELSRLDMQLYSV